MSQSDHGFWNPEPPQVSPTQGDDAFPRGWTTSDTFNGNRILGPWESPGDGEDDGSDDGDGSSAGGEGESGGDSGGD